MTFFTLAGKCGSVALTGPVFSPQSFVAGLSSEASAA